jgi:dephospho-CoA kinase
MNTILITGGIGTGKSTFSHMLREELGDNCHFFDCDEAVYHLLETKEITNKISEVFGDGVTNENGSVNKTHLRNLMLDDKGAKKKMEEIIHPLVYTACLESREAAEKAGKSIFMVDVPLLFDSDFSLENQGTVVVSCSLKVQMARLMARNQINEQEAFRRLSWQMANQEKIPLANFVVWNDGDYPSLRSQATLFAATLRSTLSINDRT